MIKINMRKIRNTTKELNDDNYLIELRYRSIVCCTYMCTLPATYKLVTDRFPNYHESFLCNKCSNSIKKLNIYQWRGIIGLYRLI